MVKWKVSKRDAGLINQIVKRAVREFPKVKFSKLDVNMDITATHANGNPLRLKDWLEADKFNFGHDLFGIKDHINRETGKLMDCFLPRFSQ